MSKVQSTNTNRKTQDPQLISLALFFKYKLFKTLPNVKQVVAKQVVAKQVVAKQVAKYEQLKYEQLKYEQLKHKELECEQLKYAKCSMPD